MCEFFRQCGSNNSSNSWVWYHYTLDNLLCFWTTIFKWAVFLGVGVGQRSRMKYLEAVIDLFRISQKTFTFGSLIS